MPLILTAAAPSGVIKQEKFEAQLHWPIVIYMSAASPGQYMHSLKKNNIAYFLLIILLTACSSNPFSQPVVVHKTPVPAMAAGEPVLPRFQIHFHDAPVPAALSFTGDDWTLAGRDN